MSGVERAITLGRGGVYIDVHAQPGARKPRMHGMHGDAIKIAVREVAQGGKANDALVHFVADILNCSCQQIEVTSGRTSRRKRLFISGDVYEITERIRKMINEA